MSGELTSARAETTEFLRRKLELKHKRQFRRRGTSKRYHALYLTQTEIEALGKKARELNLCQNSLITKLLANAIEDGLLDALLEEA